MSASEKAVAAVMEALGCTITEDWTMAPAWGCSVHTTKRWGHRGCDVAVAAADAAVDTDRPSIQAQAEVNLLAWVTERFDLGEWVDADDVRDEFHRRREAQS